MNRTQRRARDLEAVGLTPDAAAEIARLTNVVHHARPNPLRPAEKDILSFFDPGIGSAPAHPL